MRYEWTGYYGDGFPFAVEAVAGVLSMHTWCLLLVFLLVLLLPVRDDGQRRRLGMDGGSQVLRDWACNGFFT